MPGQQRDDALTIEGTLEAWAPDGNEPVLWAIHEAARPGPEGVHPLLNGDLLVVYDDTGTPVWVGSVELGFETGFQPDPLESGRMRQVAGGRWVHGLQKGEDPELWARMFFERRRAIVKR
jgi:hypothetical protein